MTVMAAPSSFCDESAGSLEGIALAEVLTESHSPSPARTACALKGGCLSIATQGSYRLSSPHPLALSTASRPGIPATAETSSRAGTRGRRAERGAEAREKGHARTSSSNSAQITPRTRRRAEGDPRFSKISYHPKHWLPWHYPRT